MASFGLAAVGLAMLPARIGYQDLAALIARQPTVGESFRAHLIASPFGTIHAATFSFPQPVGTGLPAGEEGNSVETGCQHTGEECEQRLAKAEECRDHRREIGEIERGTDGVLVVVVGDEPGRYRAEAGLTDPDGGAGGQDVVAGRAGTMHSEKACKSQHETGGRGIIILVNAEMLFEEGREQVSPRKSDGPKTKKTEKERRPPE